MEKFEAFLDNATAKSSNVIPGAAMAVVDRNGIPRRLLIALRDC